MNLELKARDPDPAATALACSQLGAVACGTLRQRDTYFDIRSGRLKLREDPPAGAAELIYYERPAVAGVRPSRYWRADVGAPDRLGELLGLALGVLGIVEKTRELYLLDHVRIHLDRVEGLGSFVELEAVLPAARASAAADDDLLDEITRALGIRPSELIPGSYLDLLLGQG